MIDLNKLTKEEKKLIKLDKKINKEYPYIAIAIRVDGDTMPGCYKNVDDDIKIQWIGGDFSVFPANVFLVAPLKGNV